MRCPACGYELVTDALRCPECDAYVDGGSADGATRVASGLVGVRTGPATGVTLESRLGELEPESGGLLEIGSLFADRYRIRRLLGIGGMGAVYEAWDERVDIPVALKLVRSDAAADPEMARQLDRRFRTELLLARQVTHRNVVRIHDLGEADGVKYITMTYIEGEVLSARLQREGPLPEPEALRIVRSVLAGLRAAHDAGVVHRDLKPGNIIIEAATDEPYIMDFGIARSVGATAERSGGSGGSAREGRPSSGSTRFGDILGTLQYMAPEQFLGQAVDQRADVYALGLIFYDLLLGRVRGSGTDSAIAELRGRLETAPKPPRTVRPETPEAVDRIIRRCLEPDPEARFASSAELEAALDRLDDEGHPLPIVRTVSRRLLVVAALVVIGLVATTWWLARQRAEPVAPSSLSVLVADLDNRTDDAAFNGAVEEALTIAMEGAGFITAFPRPSARRVAARIGASEVLDEDIARLVSRREGVEAILLSRLEREGQAFRLTVEVIDPGVDPDDSGPLTTARSRAQDRDGVLAAVAEVASQLRGELGDATPVATRLAASETFTAASLEAMRAYAKGQDLAARGRFDEALEAYQEAVAEDPGFGRAYAGMGVVYGNQRREAQAEAAFQHAFEHLDRMSERERFRTLGGYYLLVSRNYEQAIESYERLLELYPADRAGRTNIALAYLYVRDFSRAMEAGRQAVEIEPASVLKRMNFAMYAMYAGDFDTAITESKKVLEQNPSFGYALFTLGRAALAAGDEAVARSTFERLAASDGAGASLGPLGLADLEMVHGQPARAMVILEPSAAAEEEGEAYATATRLVAIAEAQAALGREADAEASIGRAVELSQQESVLYPAARLLLSLGRHDEAEALAVQLEDKLQSQTTAAASLIRAEAALLEGRFPEALRKAREGREQYDSWFAHLLLGRAYLEVGHLPEAVDELSNCVGRRGEVTDVFLVDGATLRYFPPALYWLGRAQEALGNREAAAESYGAYLGLRADSEPQDPLATDAADHLGGS